MKKSNFRFLIAISTLFAVTLFVQKLVPPEKALPGSEAIFSLGFTLIGAYLFGKIVSQFRLPKITGYLFLGILVSPYFINLLSTDIITDLRLIDNIALSLIALTAGGEFTLESLKRQWKLLTNIIGWQFLLIIGGVTGICLLLKPIIPILAQQSFSVALGAGLILSALSLATSPASAIAVITETRAKGRFTDVILEVTVAKDIIVVLAFAIVLALAEPLILPEADLHFDYLLQVMGEILLSLVVGAVVGYLIYLYIGYVKQQIFLFLAGMVLLIVELSLVIHIEIILVFMVAGFVVENFSSRGGALIQAVESNSLPIYVIFFGIAGASLNFQLFLDHWLFTLILVSARLLTTHLGTWIGATLTSASSEIR
ncbi:hypothetical protein GWN26_02765, partial [Candidatus Saccharibacteria bacterium]|nr:hypothetical protein [Calditrichia bacterium]NIV71540.1 hypothetical protein [Calditrichia bacterium]NIV98117.1 hypothetical protein [Candidatus Saccharibacteria bacterium]NIW78398.1 hypothetical protein [Calditrichia bacterium]